MTALAGLATTGLAVTLDAGHSENLHVTVDDEVDDSTDSSSGGEA